MAIWLVATLVGLYFLLSYQTVLGGVWQITIVLPIALLVLIPSMLKSCTQRRAKLWGVLGAAALVLSLIAFFFFDDLRNSRTVVDAKGISHLIGTEKDLTPEAKMMKQEEGASNEILLRGAHWKANDVWTQDSLESTRQWLFLLYLSTMLLSTFGLMALAQSGFCLTGSPRRLPVPSTPTKRSTRRRGVGKIFIAYSTKDSEFCLRLAQDLKDSGLEAWIAKLDLTHGKHWDTEVERALGQANIVLIVLSEDSVASDEVLNEASLAMDEGKWVIPILYRPCKVPLRLRRLQQFDFTGDYQCALEEFLVLLEKPVAERRSSQEAEGSPPA